MASCPATHRLFYPPVFLSFCSVADVCLRIRQVERYPSVFRGGYRNVAVTKWTSACLKNSFSYRIGLSGNKMSGIFYFNLFTIIKHFNYKFT